MAKAPAKPAAKPAAPAPAAKAGEAAEAPKSKKKLIVIVAAGLAIAIGAGVFLMMSKKGDHAEEAKVEVHAEPKFIPLDAFTVNLQKEEADQFLQTSITLKVMDPLLEEKIKAVLPEIRSKINLLLSSKRPSELLTVAGKKHLAAEIAYEANNVLGFHGVPPAPLPSAAPASEHAAEGAAAPAAEQHAAPAAETPAAAAEAPAPAPAHAAPQEMKGIVDVLFTSFIIQ